MYTKLFGKRFKFYIENTGPLPAKKYKLPSPIWLRSRIFRMFCRILQWSQNLKITLLCCSPYYLNCFYYLNTNYTPRYFYTSFISQIPSESGNVMHKYLFFFPRLLNFRFPKSKNKIQSIFSSQETCYAKKS